MRTIRDWNRIGVTALHVATYASSFLAGVALHSHPALASVGVFVSGTLIAAIVSRAHRVDEEYEMMMIALDSPTDPSEAITLPRIPAEPVTGVKHKCIDSDAPRIVSWHGKRGNG